jgi:ElaB/YqjD/DUF883 family membrane-anchored ribosome-binding protein
MSDKREQLRDRIEAAEARQKAREAGQRAADAADRVTSFAREHPFLLIAGGLAVGAALSTLIPKSPPRKLSARTIAFLASMAEFGVAYGREAMEAAEEAGRQSKAKLAELSSTAKEKLSNAVDEVTG